MFANYVGFAVLGLIALVVISALYNIYVNLIKLKNTVEEAMSGVDIQLKKRYDLIPNILTIANKFMAHERGLIEEITRLRSQAAAIKADQNTIAQKMELDKQITGKMDQLMVNVENYPQLKSDQTMMQAMQTYSEVEEHIAASRRFYNSAAKELKNAVEIFPSSVFASAMGISAYPFFEAGANDRNPVNAAEYFN